MDFYKGPSFDWQAHPRIFVFCVFFVWSFNGFYYRLEVRCVFFNDILNRIDNSCIVCFIVFFYVLYYRNVAIQYRWDRIEIIFLWKLNEIILYCIINTQKLLKMFTNSIFIKNNFSSILFYENNSNEKQKLKYLTIKIIFSNLHINNNWMISFFYTNLVNAL